MCDFLSVIPAKADMTAMKIQVSAK